MEHYSAFREFTYNLDVATCSSMLRQAAGKLLESLGFEFFMYNVFPSDAVVVSNTGQDLVLTNFPAEWVAHYMSEDFGKIDPVPEYLVTESRICYWDRLIATTALTKVQQRLKDDAMSAHISGGITLRIGSRHGEFATLICVPAKSASLSDDQLSELEPILELVGNYFHAKALNTLVRERLAAQSQMQVVSLSPREREVLYWASLGKTGWETGAILGISQKSVELHADNAKSKLAATNKTHAVAKAIMSGIIPDLRAAGDFTQLVWKMGFEELSQQRYFAH
jgi:DNA-binding CsgD family transcriptional regulator